MRCIRLALPPKSDSVPSCSVDSLITDLRIQIVSGRIQGEVGFPLDITKLSGLVNLSPSRLRHLFKIETGKTLGQYVRSLRMKQAQVLLGTTFLSVKEIMNRVGIHNASHFVHDFKRAYGLTPTSYRSAVKEFANCTCDFSSHSYFGRRIANLDKEFMLTTKEERHTVAREKSYAADSGKSRSPPAAQH